MQPRILIKLLKWCKQETWSCGGFHIQRKISQPEWSRLFRLRRTSATACSSKSRCDPDGVAPRRPSCAEASPSFSRFWLSAMAGRTAGWPLSLAETLSMTLLGGREYVSFSFFFARTSFVSVFWAAKFFRCPRFALFCMDFLRTRGFPMRGVQLLASWQRLLAIWRLPICSRRQITRHEGRSEWDAFSFLEIR